MLPALVHHQRLDICLVILPREDIFASSSPATAPEDVIPKVEPRLQGFNLKEIFFKNVQINEIKLKTKLV